MSSGFSGDFFTAGGFTGRSMAVNNPQNIYNLADPASQIHHRRPDLIGKRSLAEFQTQHQLLQQQQALGLYLRNVKPRTYQNPSPISPFSSDFSASLSPDVSSISSTSSVSSSPAISTRYGLPILQPQQIRPQPINFGNGNSVIPFNHPNFSGVSYPNLLPNRGVNRETGEESEKKMMNRLHELEKQLLDDNEDDEGDAVSVVTNSEWSETIQNLIGSTQKPISPTSSSSSCSSSSASPQIVSPKQSLIEAATAISEGKTEVASEILTRLNQVGNIRGTAEQRLTAYMVSALRSRVYPTEHPPPVAELYGEEHAISTQMFYEVSPCFKLGFMAANLAILEATSDQRPCKLHVVDFDIGRGCQYMHLIHALAARKGDNSPSLKITTFTDFAYGEEKLKLVGDELKKRANKVGIIFNFNVLSLKITDLSLERLGVEENEVLAVNFAFRLYKLPDESVTTENLRDELLRRIRGLSPAVVTVVEQEMSANTAPFMARVTEACGYYGAVFDSLDATVSRDHPDRVRIEEGLSRKAANSVACEGRDRVERCEVFGKWRARMGMAGFNPKPLSPLVSDSLRTLLNSGTCGNPGFTVKAETGGVSFGWMGRTLTVASAWR
ncbi:scarecrow-like protein 8 [Actinidia eriantha]|uniref:scarecrow-like protein 8 n=1 Tax=Actinidia eriantha TaxID=165200 RepID=UPI0025849DF2|nr:scarecrow-like protein 8 [Actinidia eriantha]